MTNSYFNPKHDRMIRLSSPEAYHDYLNGITLADALSMAQNGEGRTRFYGPTRKECLDHLVSGDTSMLGEAQAIMDKLADAHLLTVDLPILQTSVVGYVPLVPAVLAGHPENMLRRAQSDLQSDRSPLTIYIETTVSAGVTHRELINRGVACLGFVLAMSTVRPIELYAVSAANPTNQPHAFGACVKIETRPLDIGRACWMLTNPGYARRLAFTAMIDQAGHHAHNGIPWCWNLHPGSAGYTKSMRDMLGCEPQDVLIEGGFLRDELMKTDPVEWVRRMIEKHAHANTNEVTQ